MNFKHYNGQRLVIWIIILFLIESLILAKINTQLDKLSPSLKQIIEVSSLFGSLTLVYFVLRIYDRTLWKYLPKWMNLVCIPNVNGEYEGTLISSHKDTLGNPIKLKCIMRVNQTASSVYVEMDFVNSDKKTTSRSHSEQIEDYRGAYFVLQFVHQNDGNYDEADLNMHKGLTTLKYYPNTKEFKGDYFNDPHRNTHGKIEVKKIV